MKKSKLFLSIAIALIAMAGAFASAVTVDSNSLLLAAYRNTNCDVCDAEISSECVESVGVRCMCLFQSGQVNAFWKPSPTDDCVEAFRPED